MTPREVEQELDKLEPALVQAYLDQIGLTVEQLSIAQVENLIAAGRNEAVQQLVLAGAFVALTELLRAAYLRGQRLELSDIPKRVRLATGIQANPESPLSSSWLGGTANDIRTGIAVAQREAIAETLAAGTLHGRTARQMALDVVGRLETTGRRTGGAVGLSGPEARAVAHARAELASGDPVQLRAYLLRGLRDRRADPLVRAALEAGKAVPAADIDRIVGRYSARLLRSRAEQIAKTRSLEVFGAARDHVYQELAQAGYVITKTWRTRRDEKVRDSHASMNGDRVSMNQPFRSGAGSLLMYPGDESLGAPLSDRAGCRCNAIYRWRPA